MINGILIINKPVGYTSRDVVNIIGKKLGTKKVGHTGTLDPLASGVLVICVGRYTKLVQLLTSMDKEYIAEIKLGVKTDTLDITGKVLDESSFSISQEDIVKVFSDFVGSYDMEVPIYSAVKVNGKKLYQYARNNIEVELPRKKVNIYSLELIDYKDDIIKFRTKVEKGTYIRSLIRDVCDKLNVLGTMNSLIRVKQGNFSLEQAKTIEDIENDNYKLFNVSKVLDIKQYNISEEEYKLVRNGHKISLPFNDLYVLFIYQTREIAIYKRDNDIYKVYVMLEVIS